jgi:hypothetical protein
MTSENATTEVDGSTVLFINNRPEVMVFERLSSGPSDNNIGFLTDGRRLNVSLTTASYGLVIIGGATALSTGSKTWR